jgi:hypothetical protein
MPKAIDQEALESPSMKVLDINNPPTKNIAHEQYPKMVYLHPKDKTQEHKFKVVHSTDEHEAAEKQGWKVKPHVPVAVVEDYSDDFEVEGNDEADPIDSMTKAELVAEAKNRGVEIDPAAKKEVILAAIKAASEDDAS